MELGIAARIGMRICRARMVRGEQVGLRWLITAASLVALGLVTSSGAEAASPTPRLYWSNEFGNTIGAANLDGSGVNPSLITGASFPGGMAVDAQYVYWANIGGGVGRANLDGSGANQNFISGTNAPSGVAVDAQHIFWTNFGTNTIGEANLDGTGVNQSLITGASGPRGIVVDGQYVYWVNQYTQKIARANLDGTGVDESFITAGGATPIGLAIDDVHLYWTDFAGNTIGRADLSGANINLTFITGANAPFGITVDDSQIFWTNRSNNSIGEANLDGSGVNESFITATGSGPWGIAALATPGAPTGVSASAGDSHATVSFSAPAGGGLPIGSYVVTASPGGATATGSASPIVVNGLTDGTAYTFTVAATNAVGTGQTSAPSNSVTPAGAPGAPTGVTATAGNGQATVHFTAPPSNGSAITGYSVIASPGGATATGTASPLTIDGLSNGTTYTFTVTASNGLGTGSPSPASNAVTPTAPAAPTVPQPDSTTAPTSYPAAPDTQPPTAPASLTGSFTNAGLVVSWQPSTDNVGVAYYELYRNGSPLEHVPASQTQATTRTFGRSGENLFSVRAFDQAGNQSSWADTITAVPRKRPTAPKLIPRWAWYLLAWQEQHQHGAKPTPPATIPGWYATWKTWRLAPFQIVP